MKDTEKSLEETLLIKTKEEEREGSGFTWDMFTKEAKRLGYIAGPMVAVTLSLFLIQVISMMMVGHLGELALSSSAIAISLSAVTGFSVIFGMASALETLCGQAYGAKQYRKVGNHTYSAIFCLILVALLVSLLWINMEKLLIFIGQDPKIAHEAGRFTKWLIPSLFASAIFQPLLRYYQAQSLVMPMLVSAFVTLLIHIPFCWVLVFKSGLRNLGGALAASISNWVNVIILGLYMRYSSACAKTRVPITLEVFRGVGEFFRFAIPSVIMVCLTTIAAIYSIPSGLGAAASTRVSNKLGAGNSRGARMSVYSIMIITVSELVLVSGMLFAGRRIFGYSFSNEKEVVDYVSSMAPLVCLAVILDGSQGVLSGIARGCGWQQIGAYVNIGSLYLCGVPAAAILGFWLQLNGRGLWIGIQAGALLQTILLAMVTSCTDWEKQATKARERIFQGKSPVASMLV